MPRALVAKTMLDALIRRKLTSTAGCEGVAALPIVFDPARTAGCNWKVPGWTGDPRQLEAYVRFLATQFDIREESA